MKPKLVALNTLLALAIAGAAWQGRMMWNQAQATRRANVSTTVKPAPVPPIAPAPKPDAPPATKYADVAMKDLFSKDRNPTVVIEPPKVEAPKPMPPLPVVYGVLGLPDGTRAIMAERPGASSKPVREGESIGPFKILALNTQKVTFEWEDKKVEKNIDDLIDRNSRGVGPAGGNAAAPLPGGPAQNQPAAADPQRPQQAQNNPPPPPANVMQGQPGVVRGDPAHPQRACVQGDLSPAGTVTDGFRKVIQPGMFGDSCMWLPAH